MVEAVVQYSPVLAQVLLIPPKVVDGGPTKPRAKVPDQGHVTAGSSQMRPVRDASSRLPTTSGDTSSPRCFLSRV